jgi:BirA family biotin operon repressor/biotin-[acetyl-CoA-carboxylase] ligase
MSAFSQSELADIESHALVDHLVFHERSGSTNDLAASATPEDGESILFLSALQTNGRGRGENRWNASEGSLTCSLLLDTRVADISMAKRPLLPLAAGLAIRDVAADLLSDKLVQVKWPNDVMVNSRKLAGILVEAHGVSVHHVTIGMGINVANAIGTTDAELRGIATSLTELGVRVSRASVLVEILSSLRRRLSQISRNDDALISVLNRCSYLQGKEIQIDAAGRVSTGRCVRIDPDGALVLESAVGESRHLAGSVELA